MNFQDTTFCNFYEKCVKSKECKIAFTKEMSDKSVEWWGGQDAPVSFYAEKPECYEEES